MKPNLRVLVRLAFVPAVLIAAGGICRAADGEPAKGISCGISAASELLMGAPEDVTRAAQTGAHPILVILVRFADSTGTTPRPKSYYEELIGAAKPRLDHYFRDLSYGQMNLTGSAVVGWLNLPQPRSYYLDNTKDCSVNIDRLRADATAAADALVDFRTFDTICVALNQNLSNSSCGWSCQYMTLDGETRCWGFTLQQTVGQDQSTFAHEIGHALGLLHSSGPYSQVYDSRWDIMSGGSDCTDGSGFGCVGVHTIAYHKQLLGWIQQTRVYTALPGSSQNILLDRVATGTTANSYLLVKAHIGGWASRFYTFEARRFSGYDSPGGIPLEGVVIHKVDTAVGHRGAQVVDTDNNGNPNDAGAVLVPGESFADPANGLSVMVNSLIGSAYSVTISVSPSQPLPEDVTNTSDSGAGSLRNAIEYANANPGTSVRFRIPLTDPGYGSGVLTIQPQTELPAITASATVIDAGTQTAFTGNTNPSGPEVALQGSAAGQYASGLTIHSYGCTVANLSIGGFDLAGVELAGPIASGNTVRNCYLGTDASGTAAAPNGWTGVWVNGGAHNNVIGGSAANRNLLSGNGSSGVNITDAASYANIVSGNFIGTSRTGLGALGNGWSGVYISGGASGNRIGGVSADERNILSGNASSGVAISGEGCTSNTVLGNYAGLGSDGKTILANGWSGVLIGGGADNNQVGSPVSGGRNVLSGNGVYGVAILDSGTTENRVFGNYIGTDATGAFARANSYAGAGVADGAVGNQIGGTAPGEGNVLSGNTQANVVLSGLGTEYNFLQGNIVGADREGMSPVAPTSHGVSIFDGASNNWVGGDETGSGNLIAFNQYEGIIVWDPANLGNIFRRNHIGHNGNLGVNLVGGNEFGWWTTLNDPGDSDAGPNGLTNFPRVLSANSFSGGYHVLGEMDDAAPLTNYVIDIYASPACHESGYGAGLSWIGQTIASTNVSGDVIWSFDGPGSLVPSSAIAATATGPDGTSEFSMCTPSDGSADTLLVTQAALKQPILRDACVRHLFKIWGRVTVVDTARYLLDDGSGYQVVVTEPGHSLQTGWFAAVEGKYDPFEGKLIAVAPGSRLD